MEGSKAVRYWDKDGRAIKVSRNFTFNENEELRELQVVELPGLEAEGESLQGTALQTMSCTPKVQEIRTEYIHDCYDLVNFRDKSRVSRLFESFP